MSKKLILVLIASGFLGFVLINLSLARSRYRRRARRHPDQPPFFRWWLKSSAISLTVFSVLAAAGVGFVFFSYFDPFNPGASRYNHYLTTANKYAKQKKYPEAALELRNAIQLYPNDALPHLGLARMLWAQGKLKEAKESYVKAVQLNPEGYDGHVELGRLLFATDDAEAATREAEEAVRLDPKAQEPRLLLAQIALKGSRWPEAVTQYRTILAADPGNRETRNKLIGLLLAQRSFAEAAAEVEAGLKLSPKDTELKIMLAHVQSGEGKDAAAVATLQAVAAQDTVSPLPLVALGDLRVRTGEYVAALQSYEEALKRSPDHAPAMNNIALLIADHGYELDRAAELAARLYTKHPKDPAVVDTMGWVLFKQGKLDQALPLLRFAATGAPGNPAHRYHYGMALLKVGQTAAGRKELEAALKISGNFDGAAKAKAALGGMR